MKKKLKFGVVVTIALGVILASGCRRDDVQGTWEYHYNKGIRHSQKRNYDNAIAEFTNAIQMHPQNGSLYLVRGKEYANKGAFDNAIADYTKAIELNPNDDESFAYRGKAYYEKGGELKKSLFDYVTASRINPNNKVAKEFFTSFADAADVFLKERGKWPPDNSNFTERVPAERSGRLVKETVMGNENVIRPKNDQND